MQCWIINNVENLWYFFQDSSINNKLNKNSIYLKYTFFNNIHYCSKTWYWSIKLLETVIAKIENISILNKYCSFKLFIYQWTQITSSNKKISSTAVSNIDNKSAY